MTSDERPGRMDAARVRAELTVQDLWLRYLALGGTHDAFDVDGYLQSLVPLDTFQESVLGQALNEALKDSYDSYAIPMDAPAAADGSGNDRLRALITELIGGLSRAQETDQPSGGGRATPDRQEE